MAAVLGQEPAHPLMRLYAEALRDLGRFLGERSALDLVEQADGSAERLAALLARGMRFFDDRGFYKRAQIVPSDLALAGMAEFHDLDRLTIFADNLVPHVLRVDGVLRYDPDLAARIDAGELLPQGRAEQRDPSLRGARVRAAGRAHRRAAARARRAALEPRSVARVQAHPAPPHAQRLLLSHAQDQHVAVRGEVGVRREHAGADLVDGRVGLVALADVGGALGHLADQGEGGRLQASGRRRAARASGAR